MSKRVFFVAALPPPITGLSVMSSAVFSILSEKFEIILCDTSKGNLENNGYGLKHLYKIAKAVVHLLFSKKEDIVYVTISQSILGNLKDLFFMLLSCNSRLIIHLHGGGFADTVLANSKFIFWLNKVIFGRVDTAIVLSESLKRHFSGILDDSRIAVLPNFAEDSFFITEIELEKKFAQPKQWKIAYLSNMIESKGYLFLLESFCNLDDNSDFELHYAGAFQNKRDEESFLKKIANYENIIYHGVLAGEERSQFLKESHIFCLPTHYPFEGQPVSILEAYAAGCIVLTTDKGGIPDIFEDRVNGYKISNDRELFEDIVNNEKYEYLRMAKKNNKLAGKNYSYNMFKKDCSSLFCTTLI